MQVPCPLRLVLAMLVPALAMPDYDYGWKDLGPTYGRSPQCVDIPEDLRLCYTVGYHRMLLPNLLDHETMAEVKQQAGSWVPLVHKQCHPSTQVLLCSLFAPVCLDRAVYPCRWLCQAVRDSCVPIMEAFGFPWPEMLNCSRFPEGDVCISTNATDTPPGTPGHVSICPPCVDEENADSILEHLCASEFAIKSKIKKIKKDKNDKKLILQRRKKAVKLGTLKKEELKKITELYLKNGENCDCKQLENSGSQYLFMGRTAGGRYLLTGIHKWDKSNPEFKETMKRMKNFKCPQYESVFK
uniref:Secreted frizzled-related protein 1 n=1 Tax=Astyanax mexicanus TaxID=7994 RepID=W5LMN7_ASTMX